MRTHHRADGWRRPRQDNRRYIVAYRNLTFPDGSPVLPSPVFLALRDRLASDDPTVEPRRALFEDIFARLEANGVARSELVLAWDYATSSRESISGRMIAARDDAFTRVPAGGRATSLAA